MKTTAKTQSGFTLIEVTVAIAVMGMIAVLLASMLGTASSSWVKGEEVVETYQAGATALELMAREISGATIDTCAQFTVMPSDILGDHGCSNAKTNSQSAMFVAPIGRGGEIRRVGYYLERDEEHQFYRLKRLYIGPENEDYYGGEFSSYVDDPNPYASPFQPNDFLSTLDNSAFNDRDPNNKKSVVAPIADGVVAFWIQCFDTIGNPIPWASEDGNHPKTDMIFNSAALFQMATTAPFDDGTSFRYFSTSENAVKGDKLPAAVEFTMVTIDQDTIERMGELEPLPKQTNIMHLNALDVKASLSLYQTQLQAAGYDNARTFNSRVKLANAN